MIEKKKVKENFSKNASTYDENAVVQICMADELTVMTTSGASKKILEIGCGTGLYSLRLTAKYSDSEFHFIDISDKMIEETKKKIVAGNVKFTVDDAETCILTEKYDLITGNAVIQWFNDLETTLIKYYENLSSDGELVFSTFGERTFYELRDSYKIAEQNYSYSQKFYSMEEVKSIADRNNWQLEINEKEYVFRYKSLLEFLKSIKKIGASSALTFKKRVTKGELKRIEEIYIENYSENGEILATNHILYIKIKK